MRYRMGLTAVGMLSLLSATDALSATQCWGTGTNKVCRDVRPDGSSPPGYRPSQQPRVNQSDPNLRSGGYRPNNQSQFQRNVNDIGRALDASKKK